MTAGKTPRMLDSYPVSASSLRASRYERVGRAIANEGLDGLIVFSGASISTRGDVRFLTNYHSPDLYSCALFLLERDPVLLVPYVVELDWAGEMSWVNDIRLAPDFGPVIVEVIRDLSSPPSRMGLVGQATVPLHIVSDVRKLLPEVELVPADALLWKTRQVKTPEEIRLTRESARIADRVFASLHSALRPGMNEREVLAQAEHVLRAAGAEGSLLLVASTPRVLHWVALDRELRPGDLVQLSVEPIGPGGYWTQTIRTFSLGEPEVEASAAFEVCSEVQRLAAKALEPGRRLGDLAQMANEVMEGNAALGTMKVPLGHGMGLDLAYGFGLTPDNDLLAEPGMLVVLHPNLYADNYGVISGDTYVVTEAGAENLSNTPEELLIA